MFLIYIIKSRIFITVSILFVIGTIWNIHIQRNDDGIVQGKVVDEMRNGIPHAVVKLTNVGGLGLFTDPILTETDQEGRFIYKSLNFIEFDICAQKDGYKEAKKKRYHLYFKSQNFELPEPIELTK